MRLEWDEAKRQTAMTERGLDFADAAIVFSGRCVTLEDVRQDYGEHRHVTFGELAGRVVVVAWTQRSETIRIISMRKANAREKKLYREQLGEG